MREVILHVKEAFSDYAHRIHSIGAKTVEYALTASEQEGELEAAYDPLNRCILLTPRFAGVISLIAEQFHKPGDSFMATLWTLAHEVTHAISHTKVIKEPDDGKNGILIIETGIATAAARLENGNVVGRFVDREILNEAITNYYVLKMVQTRLPSLKSHLQKLYKQLGNDQDIRIVEKLISFSGENAMHQAYFERKTRPLEKGLAQKGIDPEKFFSLMGCRSDSDRSVKLAAALHLIGVVPNTTSS